VTARRTPFDNVAGRAVGRVKVATLAFVCLSAAAATTIFIAGRPLRRTSVVSVYAVRW